MNKRKPNILIIMSDQHNPHIAGCAGDAVVKTPNLDALAASGVQFTNAYCANPLCVPSRMSFMTGKYGSKMNVYDNASKLSSAESTFAHVASAGGYETVLCGRMDFVGPDQFHGFEHRIAGDVSGAFLSPDTLGDGPEKTTGQSKYAVWHAGYGKTGYEAYDSQVTARACEFIHSRADDRPYCLVVGHVLPHNPLICSKEWFDYYYPRVPDRFVDEPNPHPAIRAWKQRRGCHEITRQQTRRALAAYYGLISEMDENLGRVVQSVRDAGQADNTVIIYCSDHGDMAGEHGMWWKCCFYEGSVRVPLVVSGPGIQGAGEVRSEIVSLVDLAPTIAEMAGASMPSSIDGRSLVSLLNGSDMKDWPNEVFSECFYALFDQPSCMIRTGPWKLTYHSEFESCQLFNMNEDPDEMCDLASDPTYDDIVAECTAKIGDWWSPERVLEDSGRDDNGLDLLCGRGQGLPARPADKIVVDVNSSNEFDFGQLA